MLVITFWNARRRLRFGHHSPAPKPINTSQLTAYNAFVEKLEDPGEMGIREWINRKNNGDDFGLDERWRVRAVSALSFRITTYLCQ